MDLFTTIGAVPTSVINQSRTESDNKLCLAANTNIDRSRHGNVVQDSSNTQPHIPSLLNVNLRPVVSDSRSGYTKHRGSRGRGYGSRDSHDTNYRQHNSRPSTSNQIFHFPNDSYNNNNNNNRNAYSRNYNGSSLGRTRGLDNGNHKPDGISRSKQTNGDKSYENERSQRLSKIDSDHQASNKGDFKKPLFGYRRLDELLQNKEPHEIISVIQNPRSGFMGMIREEELRNKPDWLMLIFRILSRICSSELVDSKGEVLSSLCESNLSKHLSDYLGDLVTEKRPGPLKNMATFVEDATAFCKSVVDIIPRTAKNKNFEALIVKLKVAIANIKEFLNISINSSCFATLETTMTVLKSREQLDENTPRVRSLSDLLPPNDFREISLYPTIDDLHEVRAFIRPNITEGAYKDVDHYLDVQFRLLREDFISPLREGLRSFINEKTANVQTVRKFKTKYDNVRLYYDVQFVGSYIDQNKVGYTVCFDTKQKFTHKMNWEFCKRFMYGSLLMFTEDHFDTFFLATVLDRNVDNLKKGLISISIVGNAKVSGKAFENTYLMAESEVYFEPYYLVMKSLQTITDKNFPMKNYIVDANTTMTRIPKHIQENPVWSLSAGGESFSIADTDDWPSTSDLGLDEFQYNAFQTALTQEFVVIQGPPGTGKTFLGLKIVQSMLDNLDELYLRSPILLVCYTNHALDQFLEGILDHTNKIIRIGGQSKSERLKDFNLRSKHVRSTISRSRDTTGALSNIRSEIQDYVIILRQTLNEWEKIETVRGVLSFTCLSKVIHPKHRYAFKNDKEFLSWLTDNREFQESLPDANIIDGAGNVLFHDDYVVPDKMASSPSFAKRNNRDNNGFHIQDDFEFCDIHDEDDIFNADSDRCNVTFAYELGKINASVQQLADEVRRAKNGSDNGFITYASYHNTYGRVCHQIGNILKLYYFLKRNLEQTTQINSAARTDADYKSLRHVPANLRWSIYHMWKKTLSDRLINQFKDSEVSYRNKIKLYDELKQMEDIEVVRNARVVGITTTGAARLQTLLRTLKAKIVIIEEAAEVLEAHIVASLTKDCEHVILIGDHKQLKPSTAVYALSKRFNFDLSLFERMINNGMNCPRLNVQHRMRPEISRLIVPLIYQNLENHVSVYDFPNVVGVKKNLYFITHNNAEQEVTETMSRTNIHEAGFLIGLCRYLVLQGYSPEKITILTTYTGQMFELRRAKRENQELKEVRMIVVDKYQGEENDIILLSLVRSNSENRVGFLSIENRVCVALSRAKIGFYIIGNMECLSSASALWTNIKQTLEEQDAIGEKLTLVCQIHNIETDVSCKDDFSKVPEGGCSALCGTLLGCGHNCTSMCHIIDKEHTQYKCYEPCPKRCPIDHPCPRKCYENCGTCMVRVTRTLECGHSHEMACYIDPEKFKCPTKVTVVLPKCGHECEKPCSQNIEYTQCSFMCEDRLDCGHACTRNCHKNSDPDHVEYVCKKPCTRKNKGCKLEHYCKKLCFEECGKCTVHVDQLLPCDHPVNIPCHADVTGIKCFKYCTKVLPCGHKCKKLCSKPCDPCYVKVKKTLPQCGHEMFMECWYTPDPSMCKYPCKRTRACGHPCKNICGNSCERIKCMELVPIDLKLICGHNKSNAYCHKRNDPFTPESEELLQLCKEKCGAELSCKDICSGTCGECWQGKLHKTCSQKCGNVLICGHSCDYPCREVCPPCMKQCTYKCVHSRCPKKCGIPCVRCKENCTWRCEHMKCTRKCGDICNREPCYKPCKKRLQCGHNCIGFCGEPCPPLCRVCNKEEVTTIFLGYEDEEDARFVYLDDCKHTIESRGLEQSLSIAPEGGEITMKCCPLCKTPITKTLRFMKYVKETYRDISRVKKKIYGNFDDIKTQHGEIVRKLYAISKNVQKISTVGGNNTAKLFYEFLLYSLTRFRNGRPEKGYFEMCTLIDLADWFCKLVNALQDYDFSRLLNSQKSTLSFRINRLLDAGKSKSVMLKKPEIEFMYHQLNKIVDLTSFYSLRNNPKFDELKTAAADAHLYERVNSVGRTLTNPLDSFDDELHSHIVGVLKEVAAFLQTHISVAEKAEILRTFTFPRAGHWFHCSKCGEVYAVADCGQFNETGRCPTCKNVIGRGASRVEVRSDYWERNS